jgi:transaldolase/glucose-6-phosphate isomerase
VFLQFTAAEGDEPIPLTGYDFYTLQRAQADGDYRVLERRGRRVLRLDLGSEVDAGLEELAAAFETASARAPGASDPLARR